MCLNGRAGIGASERGYVRVRMDGHDLSHQISTRFAINEAVLHECMN